MSTYNRRSGKATVCLKEVKRAGALLVLPLNMKVAMTNYRLARNLGLEPPFPKTWRRNIVIDFRPRGTFKGAMA